MTMWPGSDIWIVITRNKASVSIVQPWCDKLPRGNLSHSQKRSIFLQFPGRGYSRWHSQRISQKICKHFLHYNYRRMRSV